eukprot:CAMPEP_0206607234 /NCGR_PEP_ID=MMETSP0325_2-20121206/52000_1 /ASSEMBLY_ACC=CAM_ASM_000347 /TAXON_ID=2866 /ORGANISM="Crypthecodinium cohnii, Strain Seligo" /LENGTH=387 /DNA_ID=CAMNT_0054124151 /DNA_START=11 /DNA_END=1174 /DNA_ORIENTATION=-
MTPVRGSLSREGQELCQDALLDSAVSAVCLEKELLSGSSPSTASTVGSTEGATSQDSVIEKLKEHSQVTAPVQIRTAPDSGRFYVAARAVAAGERVLETSPEAIVVDENFVTRVCAWCFKESTQGALRVKCETCKCAHFCSPGCQAAANEGSHAFECLALARLKGLRTRLDREQTTHLRLVLQILYRRQRCQIRGETDIVEELHTGREAFEQHKSWKSHEKRYKGVVAAFANVAGCDFHWIPQDVEAVLGGIECNGFGIWDHNRSRCLGLAVSVPASFFNHACIPNVARVRHQRDNVFYALRPIEEGEPLYISYIDPRKSTRDRVEELNSCYGFICRCPRCAGSGDLPQMCPKHLGYMIPTLVNDGENTDATCSYWCSVCFTKPPSR